MQELNFALIIVLFIFTYLNHDQIISLQNTFYKVSERESKIHKSIDAQIKIIANCLTYLDLKVKDMIDKDTKG